MARPCKIPDDPEILASILENLALGLSTRLIGNAFGISEETIRGWKRRPDFKRKLALKQIEILSKPMKDTADRFPKDFLERHPMTREGFAPPAQTINQTMDLTSTRKAAELTDDELASMVGSGQGKTKEAATGHEKQPEAHQISQVKGDEEGPKVVH